MFPCPYKLADDYYSINNYKVLINYKEIFLFLVNNNT